MKCGAMAMRAGSVSAETCERPHPAASAQGTQIAAFSSPYARAVPFKQAMATAAQTTASSVLVGLEPPAANAGRGDRQRRGDRGMRRSIASTMRAQIVRSFTWRSAAESSGQ